MTKTQNGKSGSTRKVSIVGTVVGGRSSYSEWYGRCVGSESIIEEIGSEGDIDVYINSPGGSVFAGFEMVNAFNAARDAGREVTIYVSAMAASIASYIACGVKGAKVYMSSNAKMMFHAPWTFVLGSKDELRDTSNLLEKMEDDIVSAVASRGATADREWFAAGRTKWLSSKECLDIKLADGISNPPSDLISYVSSKTKPSYMGYEDKVTQNKKDNENKTRFGNKLGCGFDPERFAASVEFCGFLATLCEEHFGEPVSVTEITETTFKATKEDGSFSLLKFYDDPLNIVSIDWENAQFAKQTEKNMNKQVEETKADNSTASVDDTKIAGSGAQSDDGETAVEGQLSETTVKAESKAETQKKTVSDATVKNETSKTVTLPEGMTEDMITFARENYEKQKAEYIQTIKASKANGFTDEELGAFNMKTLEKMAKIAETQKAETQTAPKADSSILTTPDASVKSEGTLPPPEY